MKEGKPREKKTDNEEEKKEEFRKKESGWHLKPLSAEGREDKRGRFEDIRLGCLIGAKSWILDLSGIFQLGLG